MSSIFTIGGKTVQDITIGAKQVQSIYDNTNQVLLWEKPEPNYFYFEDRSGEANSISIGSVYAGTTEEWLALEYSTDKNTWTTWDFSQTLTLPANGRVYLRGNNKKFSVSSGNYHYFGSTGDVYAGGSVVSLYNKQVPNTINSNATMFGFMFSGMTTLVGVDTNLFAGINYGSSGNWRDTTNMFYHTFSGCSSLVTPPDLSGLGYAKDNTFRETFNQCTSLITTAPLNIIETMPNAKYTFRSMYFQCYALVDASPMRVSCSNTNEQLFYQTFMGSNNLVTPPDLTSITTLGNQSLYRAFYGCTSLTSLRVGFTQWGSETSTDSNYRSNYQWTYNINTNGVFSAPATLPKTRNSADNTTTSDFIPYNWAVADTDGKLYTPVITNNNNTITITETEGGTSCQIYYTTDGTIPTPQNGILYTQPFNVSSGTTVRAIAHYNGAGSAYVSDSDYAEVVTGAITVYGYPFGDNRESGNNLRDNTLYFCVGTPDDGEHYYIMKNSNWSTNVYNGQTSYYDTGTPVTVGTDINGRLYIASTEISNPTKYRHQLTRNSGQGIGHFIGALQYNPSDTPDPGTRLWEDPNVYERDKGMWMPSANGATWYTGYRLKYGPVTHGSNYLGKCFYLSTDTTNDYSVMFFRADTQVIYINN